jgi:hypothetical protein
MFRLIYFNPSIGYKAFDYKQDMQLSEAQQIAVDTSAIVHKCEDFDTHREQIDQLIFDPKVMGLYF